MKTHKNNNTKSEDVPADVKEIQKNMQGQGQGEDAQDEFLDHKLDNKGGKIDEVIQSKNEDKELIKKWEEIRIYFMMKNTDLIDMDVTHGENDGDFNLMLERIELKTGKNKKQLRNEILNWEDIDSLKGEM